jgi:hypothetical protein
MLPSCACVMRVDVHCEVGCRVAQNSLSRLRLLTSAPASPKWSSPRKERPATGGDKHSSGHLL